MDIAQLSEFFDRYGKVNVTRTSQGYNILRIAELGRDERRHTKILAWLLDHQANHDQHRLFFDTITGLCGIGCATAGDYDVNCFVPGRESEIDIRIVARGRFVVDLEVKVSADEGENQCAKEYRDMQRFASADDIPLENRFAVLLTLDGRSPKTAGPDDDWIGLSWRDLRRGFERLICGDDLPCKLRDTIGDWLDIIRSLEEARMDFGSKLAQFLLSNYRVVEDIIEENERLRSGFSEFLLSLQHDLKAKPWWGDGWIFNTYPLKNRIKTEAFVVRRCWLSADEDCYKVQFGVEGFTVENLLSDRNGEMPSLYVWIPDKKRTGLITAARDYLLSHGKIRETDDIRATKYLFRRYIPKYTSSSMDDFEATMKGFILQFFDDYAQILGTSEFDKLVETHWP